MSKCVEKYSNKYIVTRPTRLIIQTLYRMNSNVVEYLTIEKNKSG